MASTHNGILNTTYGCISTNEEFNKDLKRVMQIHREGYDLQFYRNKFNQIVVKRGGVWHVMVELAEQDPFYKA